jgi:hypothetical protein
LRSSVPMWGRPRSRHGDGDTGAARRAREVEHERTGDFLRWVGTRLRDAEVALHNGDAAPRFSVWSRNDPVTVLGAWKSGSGHQEVGDIFR